MWQRDAVDEGLIPDPPIDEEDEEEEEEWD
jgi:hypothetical protein